MSAKQLIHIRHAYSPPLRVRTEFPEGTLAKQSMQDECDINQIMAKFQKTGVITHANNNAANYGFAPSEDFAASMRIVAIAQTMFDELPSSVRKRFGNSPENFLEFVQDEDNADEMISMGLANAKPKEPAPVPAPAPAATPPAAPLATATPSPEPSPGESPGGTVPPT